MFLRFLKKQKMVIVFVLLSSMLILHAPPARAQDIAAICKGSTADQARANPLEPIQDAHAQFMVGFTIIQPASGVGSGAGMLGTILSSNVIPIVGQIITGVFVGYFIISKLLNREPLPGPGALTVGPPGYAMVGFGYGSDDKECWISMYEGELQTDGTISYIGEQMRRECNFGGSSTRPYEVFAPKDKYAVGWRYTPSRTSGGRPYKASFNDGFPELPCYFQIFRKVDAASGTLIGPLLGWSGRGLDDLDPRDYNGTCDERDYRGGFDLKTVRLVSDLPDPSNNARSVNNRCRASGGPSDFNECQFHAPVVDIADPDLPPSRRVIYGIKLATDDDAFINGLCLAYNVSGRVIVRSQKAEDTDTDLGLPFVLQGPSPVTCPTPAGECNTVFDNQQMELGSYTLSVPPGTESLFPGYDCKLRIIDQSFVPGTDELVEITDNAPCTETLTGNLDAVRPTEFLIEFSKDACVPVNCDTVVAGGAQCGAWSNRCDTCIPGDPNPDNVVGCLDCGTCTGAGEVCTAEGRCLSELDASCGITPSLIREGEEASFSINVANGIEPYTCFWSSEGSSIDGISDCAFTETFSDPGIYNVTVDVTDSSDPPKTKPASCALIVEDVVDPTVSPGGGIPDYSLCEAYKVLIRYGIPLFSIMIVLAGFYLFFSLGDPARVVTGKKALVAGISGLLVLLLAKPIFVSLVTFLGFHVYLCGSLIS